MKKKYINITIVSFIIGFMLFVQYNTVQNPSTHDTRNIWEIRNSLSEELKVHSKLLADLEEANAKIHLYEEDDNTSPQQILQETYNELRKEAGALSVSGPGFSMAIEPSPESIAFGYDIESIQPILLTRLVNELNRNDARYIEIDGERLTMWSAIRDINGNTTVNGRPINKTNIEITVIGKTMEEATKIYNYILASSLIDEFYIDNLSINVSPVKESISINAIADVIQTESIQVNE